MTISERLRTLRERAGVGQAEVAAAADVSVPTVSEWESGKKKPGREKLDAVARFYNVSTDFLIRGGLLPRELRAETDDEEEILRLYRARSDATRSAILTLLRSSGEAQS